MLPKELYISLVVWKHHNKTLVERKCQHHLAVASALRVQTNLPLKFWGDCVLTVLGNIINKF